MLAHVKTPLIDVEIKGKGLEIIEKILKKAFSNIEITHDYDIKDTVPIKDTEWYNKMSKKMTAGKILRVYRSNAGLTLNQLSEKTGIAKSNLSQMENDKRSIGIKTAKTIAKALKCDYKRFL